MSQVAGAGAVICARVRRRRRARNTAQSQSARQPASVTTSWSGFDGAAIIIHTEASRLSTTLRQNSSSECWPQTTSGRAQAPAKIGALSTTTVATR